MIVMVVVSLIALWLTYMQQIGKIKNGLMVGMALVTIVAAIRYDFSSDYWGYYEIFNDVNSQNTLKDWQETERVEPVFALICILFEKLGYNWMIAAISIFEGVVFYILLKKYCPQKWLLFGMFIYLFDGNLYLFNISLVRQSFACCIFIALLPLLLQRKILIPLLSVVLCLFIHNSSIVFLIAIVATYFYKPSRRYFYIIGMPLIFLGSFILKDVLVDLFVLIFASDLLGKYDIYSNQGSSFGLGFLIQSIPFVLSMIYLARNYNEEEKCRMVILSSIASLTIPLAQMATIAMRVSLYFSCYSIVTYPYIYSSIKNRTIRISLLCLFVLFTLYLYWNFFHMSFWIDDYMDYHSIFSKD